MAPDAPVRPAGSAPSRFKRFRPKPSVDTQIRVVCPAGHTTRISLIVDTRPH